MDDLHHHLTSTNLTSASMEELDCLLGHLLTHDNTTDSFTSATSATSAPSEAAAATTALNSAVCRRHWDGLLCWPETPAGESVTLGCFKHLHGIKYDGNVTRLCQLGGTWQMQTDYTAACVPLNKESSNDTIAYTHDVYFAGYCFSLFALVIAMVIFLAFKELRCLRNTIHTQLILTYILADALWLTTSIQSIFGLQLNSSCVTFILLHYFHLTNFFWMFVEGLYLYVLVVHTFMGANVKFRTYALLGWGIPLLLIVTWVVVKWVTQADAEVHKSETEGGDACLWLSVSMYDWIHKAPAIIVLAANSLFLLQIMWVLITKLRSATNPETQQSRKAAKALVVLMPLLGITYVLVLRGSSQTPVYEYTRAVLISTQGFLVALLYCFLNGEVRIALRHRWARLQEEVTYNIPCLGSCCCCCSDHDRAGGGIRDWSPRSRTESIRLCTPTQLTPVYRKRESCTSEVTTLTTVLGPQNGSSAAGLTLVTAPGGGRKTSCTKMYNLNDATSPLML